MLSYETQQRAREALRQVDQLLQEVIAEEEQLIKRGEQFRDTFFSAFGYLETETLSLRELQINVKRTDRQQLQIETRGRPTFFLQYDPELAYDRKPIQAASEQGQQPETPALELASRLYAVMAPPFAGVMRYYTIFDDGNWKRTTFQLGPKGVHARSALVQRIGPDVLAMEGIDLIKHIATIYPLWDNLASQVETLTAKDLQDRAQVKRHFTGLGSPRRSQQQ